MDVKQIVKLNNQFYQSVSKDFSKSRQRPWVGWGRAVKKIREYFDLEKSNFDKTLKILDVGCGNGRFFSYINDKLSNISYTGLDINNDLLNDAKKNCKDNKKCLVKFLKKDVIKDFDKIKGSYDVVVGFGVTHHIPNEDFRTKWFDSIIKLADKKSYGNEFEKSLVILSFWDFEKKAGDYLVSWDNKIDTPRYCHKYSDSEIREVIKQFKDKNFQILDKYIADNKNIYLIFGRI